MPKMLLRPVRSMFRHQENVTFRMATVTGIDVPDHKIKLEDESLINYDWSLQEGRLLTTSTLRVQRSMRFRSTL